MATGLQDPKASGPYDPERNKKRSAVPDTHEFALPDTQKPNATYDPEKFGSTRGGLDDIGPGHQAASAGELGDAERGAGGGFYNAGGDSGSSSKADSRDQLKNSEAGGDDNDTGFYNNEGGKKQKGRSRFRITRKRGAIISLGSTGLIAAIFGFFSISSGPLEFIHIAQLMEQYHFSNQEDADDNRLSKLARYIRDPDKPQDTRLGIVGNAVANNLESKINDATGLESTYDTTTGNFQGYKVLTDNERWDDMSEEEIKATLINEYGGSDANITVTRNEDGSFKDITYNPDTRTGLGDYLNPIGTYKAYRAQMSMATGLLTDSDLNNLSARAGARVLKGRAGWTMHPIEELDSAIQNQLVKGGAKAAQKLKEKLQEQFTQNQEVYDQDGPPTEPGGEPSAETKEVDGKTTTDPFSEANQQAVADVQTTAASEKTTDPATIDNASTSLGKKIAGGGAGLIAVICVLRGVDSAITEEREAKVILPMERFAGQFISLGSQIQSGQDIDATQLGFFKEYLDGTNSSGDVTSTWDQADSIQAEMGNQVSGQHDLPTQGQVFTTSTPFGFLNGIPLVKQACGLLSSPLGTLFSIVSGPVNYIISGAVIKHATSFLANWLTGEPINFTASAGADDGSYLDYGSRLSANQQFESAGGVPLSPSDESDVDNTSQEAYNQQFDSKSLTYRLLNPDDSRTLVAKVMDSYGSQGPTSGFASMFRGLGSIFSDALKVPTELFSGRVNAAASEPYNYHGLEASGFTAAQLSAPAFDNPFDNACYVVGGCTLSDGTVIPDGQGILGSADSPNQTYISQIAACFNDNVAYDGGSWNIGYTSGGSTDVYDSSYPTSACESTDESWMRIRFWLLDTQTVEGYDCSQGNSSTSDQSCQDIGYDNSSDSDGDSGTTTTTTPTTTTPAGTLPTGTSQQLAKELLPYIADGKIKCGEAAGGTGPANCLDIQNSANGTPIGGNCAVSALTPHLLGLILGLVQQDNWTLGISAICSNHSPEGNGPYAGHSYGQAADFSIQNGATGAAAAADQPFVNDAAALLSTTGGSFGQIECHGDYPVLDNPKFTTFNDTCTHQHIRAAP